MNGTRPDFKVASVSSLRSLTLTLSPLAANDSTNGMPTWPAPPTTVKSAVFAEAARAAAGRSAMFNALLRRSAAPHQGPPFSAKQHSNGDAIDDRAHPGKHQQAHLVAQRTPARKHSPDRPLAKQKRGGQDRASNGD